MALDGFVKLAPEILLYTPPNAAIGQLVILGTWMGAADKYIAKYVELHKKQLPTASILLLKSGVSSMISPYKKQQAAIEPAMIPILSLLEQCKESKIEPRILLHIFSNGGINSATHLLIDLNRKRKAPMPLIAFMYSFPQRFPTSIAASSMVHTLLILLFLSVAMGRYENPEDFWRKAVLDKSLIDSNRVAYVASKADKQTDWRDVVSHAEVARKQGWEVKEIILEDTPHCNHLKKDPQMYHDLATRMWEGHEL
jgi:hypothetical protein